MVAIKPNDEKFKKLVEFLRDVYGFDMPENIKHLKLEVGVEEVATVNATFYPTYKREQTDQKTKND